MTMDKSLRLRAGLTRARSVLSRAERIERLKSADRWKEGDDPLGLPKVRVYKLALKKKKKKVKEGEEGAEGAAAAPGTAAPAAKPAATKAGATKAGATKAGATKAGGKSSK